jgi:acetyl esterase
VRIWRAPPATIKEDRTVTDVATDRSTSHETALGGTGEVEIVDRTIAGPHGGIPVRTYLPPAATRGLVWAHGGAFAFGGLDQLESDWVARELAARGVAVVAVDYRLSPTPDWLSAATGLPIADGVHFPVASDEVTEAFRWATTLVPTVAPDAWSIGGASAGANLVTGAALRLRDASEVSPRSLVLAYGLFHATLPPLGAELAAKYAALPAEAAVFSPEVIQLINLNYVGDPAHLTSSYAFPGGHHLAGLPPAFLVNSDADSLRASGEQFAAELVAAGVDTLVAREPDTLHGHLDGPAQPGALRSIDRIARWLTTSIAADDA